MSLACAIPKAGLEVDFILGNAQFAIEVKISDHVHQQDLKGLLAFCEGHPATTAVVVSQGLKPRLLQVKDQLIRILPWQNFLSALWRDEFVFV